VVAVAVLTKMVVHLLEVRVVLEEAGLVEIVQESLSLQLQIQVLVEEVLVTLMLALTGLQILQ
tara:strand:- start:65 stop:253 length:189 start_codon:yes stop_codon:yes gene_type:complete